MASNSSSEMVPRRSSDSANPCKRSRLTAAALSAALSAA
jgi:hypothetical protein